MSNSNRFWAVVLVFVSVTIALLIPHERVVSAGDKLAPVSHAGRYQYFKNPAIARPNEDCLLDTATGKVWKLSFDTEQRAKWVLAVEAPK